MKFEMLPDQIQLEAARCLREAVAYKSDGERGQIMELASVIKDAFCELYQSGASPEALKSGGKLDKALK